MFPLVGQVFFLLGCIPQENPPANAGDIRDVGLIPGLGRSPGEGHANPVQCPCLENPMDRGAWLATAHGVTKSQTQLKRLNTHTPKPLLPLRQGSSLCRQRVRLREGLRWEPSHQVSGRMNNLFSEEELGDAHSILSINTHIANGHTTWMLLLKFIIKIMKSPRQNYNSKRYMHPYIHSSTIYNNQDMKTN